MSKPEITIEQIESKFAAHRAKVKAREDRIRKEELELERERAAFVAEGQQYFDGRLNALREQAIGFAVASSSELAKLPPKPEQPKPELVSSVGFEEYMRRADAFPAAAKAHLEAALAACAPLAAALRGLVHEAGSIRRQARELGFACYQGVGFLLEAERGPRPGTALIAFGHSCDNAVEGVARAAECGELTAAQAGALADMLRKPAPAPAQPAQPERVWRDVVRATAEREQAAELAARGGAPLTQTQRDVASYTDRQAQVWPGGGRPVHVTNLELERNGFARIGGAE